MPTVLGPDRTAPRTGTPLRGWLAVVAVTLGIFAIVTTEILPIGLLGPIGAGFDVSAGTAGWMMTVPGLVAALAAPVVTVTTGRVDRRMMLCALLALLTAANVLAAVAPNYPTVLVARLLVGLTIGGFWSIGAGLAPRLVPARSAARATALIVAAVPLGSVLGVPAGTLVGDAAGWRAAFAALAVLSAVVLTALVVLLPALPAERVTRPAVLRGALRRTGVRTGLLVTVLVVAAHFGTYTYVTPLLTGVGRIPADLVAGFLLLYGAAGVAGNFLAGAAVTRRPRTTLAVAAALIATATLLLPVLGRWPVGAAALLVVWGLAYGAVPVSTMTWFTRATPDAPEAATVVFTASFQATIAAGALTGGVVVDASSPSTVMLCGAGLACLAALAIWRAGPPERA